jgi:cellobiose phosphorylase
MNPGYIKGYLPGVRENGGQYTHAATWLIMATAALRNKERTYELINMINPLNHGATADGIRIYKIEPYVIAADVYAVENHLGRGGWTWYTGSAGWMYQLLIESFFGIKRNANKLWFEPCLPENWPAFTIEYRYGDSVYELNFDQRESWKETSIILDETEQEGNTVFLVNDRENHRVTIRLPLTTGKAVKQLAEIVKV